MVPPGTSPYFSISVLNTGTGHFSKAIEAWEQAWNLGKEETEPHAKALADRALGEIAEIDAWIGRYEELQSLFTEIGGRDVSGPATVKLGEAKEGLWLMQAHPESAFKCGPYAVGKVWCALSHTEALPQAVLGSHSTKRGTSLADLLGIAQELGMRYQVARREPGSKIVVPSVVHWKIGHYGALVREENGHYLLQDPSFDFGYRPEQWITPAALDSEASGYFIVPAGDLPKGWESVRADEAANIWGRGSTTQNNPDDTTPCDTKTGGNESGCCCGMARYAVDAMLVSLNIMDTPLTYACPRGPAMDFTVTYNQKEANQPSQFYFSNFGPKWVFKWLSYLEPPIIFSQCPPPGPCEVVPPTAVLHVRGGGTIRFGSYDPTAGTFASDIRSGSQLFNIGTNDFERRFPDGSKEVYAQVDPQTGNLFLSQIVDAQSNTVSLVYDSQLRIVAVQDALGQVTTLSYEMTNDIL